MTANLAENLELLDVVAATNFVNLCHVFNFSWTDWTLTTIYQL